MRGDAQMATEFYRRAARGADDYSRIAGARYAEALGELDEALKLANDAVEKSPKLWETHLALAEIRAKRILAGSPSGYDEESLEEVAEGFREVTKLDPLHARAFAGRADFLFDAYRATQDESFLKEASKDAERAAEIDPKLCYARFIRARTLIALGRPRDALGLLDTVLEDEPWRSRAWVDKGRACLMIPDLDEAGVCFEEALKLDENSVVARLGLVNVYLRLRKCEMALRSLKKLAELREDWPEAHLLLGQYYLGAPGRVDPLKAKKEGELVDQWTGGGDVRAKRLLAQATFDLKEYEEAKGHIREGLKRAPGDEYLLNLLSRFKD